jgi:hypothetical protein
VLALAGRLGDSSAGSGSSSVPRCCSPSLAGLQPGRQHLPAGGLPRVPGDRRRRVHADRDRHRGRAVRPGPRPRGRDFTSIFPIGGIIGPVIGGVIVTYWPWREIFLVNVPAGLLLILLGAWAVLGFGALSRSAITGIAQAHTFGSSRPCSS